MRAKSSPGRAALLAAALGLAAGSSGAAQSISASANATHARNVILLVADDLGWKDLSATGNRQLSTPHIDRLADEGIRFTHAFVVASSCSPSRASLITGQYPHTHGVTGLTHIHKTRSLSPFHQTLPKLLRKSGFNTALQGKWHVSPFLPTSWYGYSERLSGILAKQFRIDDSKKAVDFIERNRGRRFYLELNFMQNHRDDEGEFHFDPEFPVDPDEIKVPEYWALPDWPEIREDVARYFSQTLRMDALVGEVLDALDDLQLSQDTLVIFVSDNGVPYPGSKMTLYDRGTGTPLLIRWPRQLESGRVVDRLVSTIDVMPTILEAAGVGIPDDVEGRSLLALMKGQPARSPPEVVFAEMTHHVHPIPTRSVRTRRWKYIKNYSDVAVGLDQNAHDDWAHRLCDLPNQPWKRPRVEEELYDLEQDPHEQVNLAGLAGHAQQLEGLRELLRQHMLATDDPFLERLFSHDYQPETYERRN